MENDGENGINRLYSRRYLTYIGLCFVVSFCFSASVQAKPSVRDMEILWEKSFFYFKNNQWVPGEVFEHEQTFNLNGKMVEETQAHLSLRPAPFGKIEIYVESAIKNGKDVTGEAQREITDFTMEEILEEVSFMKLKTHISDSSFNGRSRQINGVDCAGFDFKGTAQDQQIKGTAWLEQVNGLPTEIETQVTSVPFTIKGVKIKSYKEKKYFILTGEGQSMLASSDVDMDIESPELEFNGSVSTRTTYKKHWWLASAQ